MENIEIILNRNGANVRRETVNGRLYFVAPLTMIVPGVLPGSKGPLYYSPREVAHNHKVWNYTPIVVYHPFDHVGNPASARDPGVLEKQGIGHVRNSRIDNGKLKGEGWFDVERTRLVDKRVLDSLENGQPIELSTGLFTENIPAPSGSVHNGRPYDFIATKYKPDHLAILPDQVGACSINDGCGVLINRETDSMTVGLLDNRVDQSVLTDNLGKGNWHISKRREHADSLSDEADKKSADVFDNDSELEAYVAHKDAADAHRNAARTAANGAANGGTPDYEASGYHGNKAQYHAEKAKSHGDNCALTENVAGEEWITISGTHVLVDGGGNIVGGPEVLKKLSARTKAGQAGPPKPSYSGGGDSGGREKKDKDKEEVVEGKKVEDKSTPTTPTEPAKSRHSLPMADMKSFPVQKEEPKTESPTPTSSAPSEPKKFNDLGTHGGFGKTLQAGTKVKFHSGEYAGYTVTLSGIIPMRYNKSETTYRGQIDGIKGGAGQLTVTAKTLMSHAGPHTEESKQSTSTPAVSSSTSQSAPSSVSSPGSSDSGQTKTSIRTSTMSDLASAVGGEDKLKSDHGVHIGGDSKSGFHLHGTPEAMGKLSAHLKEKHDSNSRLLKLSEAIDSSHSINPSTPKPFAGSEHDNEPGASEPVKTTATPVSSTPTSTPSSSPSPSVSTDSSHADSLTEAANKRTKLVKKAGNEQRRIKEHIKAGDAHMEAAEAHEKAGNTEKAAFHMQAAIDHHERAAKGDSSSRAGVTSNQYKTFASRFLVINSKLLLKGSIMERAKAIAFLTTNCRCWKGPDDREVLAGMSDYKLNQLVAAVKADKERQAVVNAVREGFNGGVLTINAMPPQIQKALAKKAAPAAVDGSDHDGDEEKHTDPDVDSETASDPSGETDTDSRDLTTDETPPGQGKGKAPMGQGKTPVGNMSDAQWLSTAPPRIREVVQNALAAEKKERDSLIRQIVANVNPSKQQKHINALSKLSLSALRDQLELVNPASATSAASRTPDYSLAGGYAPVANADMDQDDILTIPVINWAEEAKQRQAR